MFKILPDHPVEWEEVWLGAGIEALLFTVGQAFDQPLHWKQQHVVNLRRCGRTHHCFGVGLLFGADPLARRRVREGPQRSEAGAP